MRWLTTVGVVSRTLNVAVVVTWSYTFVHIIMALAQYAPWVVLWVILGMTWRAQTWERPLRILQPVVGDNVVPIARL